MNTNLLKLFTAVGLCTTIVLCVTFLCKITDWDWQEVFSAIGAFLLGYYSYGVASDMVANASKQKTESVDNSALSGNVYNTQKPLKV